MSFRKNGRKLRPEFGKLLSNSAAKLADAEDFDFTAVIAETLRETFGGTAVSIKTVMGYTGAGERAVRNWFEGKNGPNGRNLAKLARNSDEVLEVFLLMADRREIMTAKALVDARSILVEMLRLIEQLEAANEAVM
jgi:hypothetical protein